MNADFPDLPTANRAFPTRDRHAVYVKPPTSSLDWAGADWDTPVSLTFHQEVMNAEILGANAVFSNERPAHPRQVIRAMQEAWNDAERHIASARRVVDAQETVGFTFRTEERIGAVVMTMRLKCWPAIEGVTVPKRDVTW